MAKSPEATTESAARSSQTAWPPMRIGLYTVLIVLVLILIVLVRRDAASTSGNPPMPPDATVVSPGG